MEYNKRFKSGSEIRLARIFDNDIKIIIPDLQRDYCWGETKCKTEPNKTLAFKFAEDLIKNFREKNNDPLPLGLIYGYEVPAGHIQLCDGQQRITTLYLLLGILNRRTQTLADRLISQREMDNNNEPYLQFAIRESTLYFMTDLVSNFFLSADKELKVKDIQKQNWYFKDYDLDPSVKSMLMSLKDMEEIVDNLQDDEPYRFAYYLCNNVRFIYYDMQTRLQGEETFVIINTTGESLSVTENIKPSFIKHYEDNSHSKQYVSDEWEEWESFFWQNRGNGNDTADAGMTEFFRWVSMLKYTEKGYQNKPKESKEWKEYTDLRQEGILHFHLGNFGLDELREYFDLVQRLFFEVNYLSNTPQDYLSPNASSKVNQMNWYRVLPLMKYLKRFPNATKRELMRFSEFLKHTSMVKSVSKSIADVLPSLLKGIEQMKSSEILELQNAGVSSILFTPEVLEKFRLCPQKRKDREVYEDELWKAEDQSIWVGEIMPLIQWAKRNGKFNLNEFCSYRDCVAELLGNGHNHDLLSQTLLVKNSPDYPCNCEKFMRSLTNCTFGSKDEEWREVIEKNTDVFGDIINSLRNIAPANYDKELQNQIDSNLTKITDPEKRLIASRPEFLQAINKNVQNRNSSMVLIQKTNATKAAYVQSFNWKLFVESEISINPLPAGWELQGYWWDNDGGCTYFHYSDSVTGILYRIDVAWRPDGKYHIGYFCKENGDTSVDCAVKGYSNRMVINKENNMFRISIPTSNTNMQVLNYIRRLMN